MKVKNDAEWANQLSEFTADEPSQKFRDFVVLWVDTAEVLHADGENTPRAALGKAFEVAEQTFGFLSVEWLSQMLLVIVQHWVHGDAVWESLSAWERRMVEQATALKLVELQESATLSADEPQDQT